MAPATAVTVTLQLSKPPAGYCPHRPFDRPLPEAAARQLLPGKGLTSGVRPDAYPFGRVTMTVNNYADLTRRIQRVFAYP